MRVLQMKPFCGAGDHVTIFSTQQQVTTRCKAEWMQKSKWKSESLSTCGGLFLMASIHSLRAITEWTLF
jgi:hypothetical protein